MIPLLVTADVMSSDPHSKVLQRINYGVVFKEEAHLVIAKESWLHTFEIELPKVYQLSKNDFCSNRSQECNFLNSEPNFVYSIHKGYEMQLHDIVKAIHSLIPQTQLFNGNRVTRSFLPFIGTLAKGLFGTATMSDVELLARHINVLNKRTELLTNVLHQHGDHLSSFMSVVDHRTTNLMKGIQTNANEIAILANSFNMSLLTLHQSMINMSKELIKLTNNVNMLRASLDQYLNAIQSLVEGHISPLLLPQQTLTRTLHHIQKILTDSYPGFHLTQFHHSYYYTNGKFMFLRNHSMLYLTVRFPISTHANPLQMFRVISLPVPVNNSLQHATQILDLPEFYAITHYNDHFVSLSASQLTTCQHDSTITCSLNLALTPSHVKTCISALYNNDMKQIKQLCEFRFLENHLTHDIIELNPTSVLVYMSDTLAMDCPDKRLLLPGCQFCVVNLPCKCSLSSKFLSLSPRLVQCYNNTLEVSVSHPVNLALLQEFFDEEKFKSITANTMFKSPVSMSIPNFTFYSHNVSSILADDKVTHLSLKKMVAAAKQDEVIFKTLTEPLLDGMISLDSEWPDTNAILIFVAIGISSFATITCIFLFIKIRKMATAMLVLQQLAKAKGQDVPSFIFHKVTETPAPTKPSVFEQLLYTDFSWLHASVIMSTLVLIFLLVLICFLYRQRKSKCTKLYLEVTSGGDCVMVPILNLSLCPSYYEFSTPTVKDISLSSFPSCKMFVIYSRFVVKNRYTSQSVHIPTNVTVGLFSYYKLKRILSQPFNAYVLVTHQGFASTLNPACYKDPEPVEDSESSLVVPLYQTQ